MNLCDGDGSAFVLAAPEYPAIDTDDDIVAIEYRIHIEVHLDIADDEEHGADNAGYPADPALHGDEDDEKQIENYYGDL